MILSQTHEPPIFITYTSLRLKKFGMYAIIRELRHHLEFLDSLLIAVLMFTNHFLLALSSDLFS